MGKHEKKVEEEKGHRRLRPIHRRLNKERKDGQISPSG
jgi:hypothetical protein